MPTARFTVIYGGPALEDGTMATRDLGRALIGIGDLIAAVNQELNGDRCRVEVRVRSRFDRGSFEVSFEVLQSLWGQAKQLLLSDDVVAAATILSIIGFDGRLGLVSLLQWLRGRTIRNTRPANDPDHVVVEADGDVFEAHKDAVHLAIHPGVRVQLGVVVSPLREEGVDYLESRGPSEEPVRITKEDLPYVVAIPHDERPLTENVQPLIYAIVSPSFDRNRKWVMNDGGRNLYVSIEDEEFLDRVGRGEIAFKKGDLIHAEVRIRQHLVGGKLKQEQAIVRVLDLIQPRQQELLPK